MIGNQCPVPAVITAHREEAMNTLIIQNSFEPYYAGKESFSAPCSEPVENLGLAQQ